jgi:ferritin
VIKISMLSEEIVDILCHQISHEIMNAIVYLRMAGFLNSKGLKNIAQMFEKQHDEEMEHSGMVYNFLMDMGVDIIIPPTEGASMQFTNPEDLAILFMNREIFTTQTLAEIRQMAIDAKDVLTEEFSRKMIEKQIKETSEFTGFIDQCNLCGDDWYRVKVWNDSMEK